MNSEMEACIKNLTRTLCDIKCILGTQVCDSLKKIVDEGVSLKRTEQQEIVSDVSCGGEVVATSEDSIGGGQKQSMHCAGDLLVPGNLEELPVLEVARTGFVAPETIDLRDYCVQTRDQMSTPWCAAYSATSFKSNIYWRKKDVPEVFDVAPIYSWAKQNDGSPDASGTTLNAALQALIEDGSFSKDMCKVKVLRTVRQIKYAIHKFGCCLVGLDVTTEWTKCYNGKSTISGKTGHENMGGHAVLACGYNRDGLIIQNSWGEHWGAYGFALVTWEALEREFLYGAVIDNCLYETRMN